MRGKPDLSVKITAVEENMRRCELCPWLCGVDRMQEQRGYCGLGSEGHIFHHYLSYSEEPEISPTYEILFSGCSHRCRFCSVIDYVEEPLGRRRASFEEIEQGLRDASAKGLATVSFVGGEPTVNLLHALKLLEHVQPTCPIVWNSNMFMTPFVHDILDDVVDVFVADIHFGNDECARRVGHVIPYFDVVTRNISMAARYGKVILRHLLVPGHHRCCFEPIARWAAEHLPQVELHILDTFFSNDRFVPSGDYCNEVIITSNGKVVIKHLTTELLDLALDIAPSDSRALHAARGRSPKENP